MGKLLTKDQLELNPDWYFSDAYYEISNGGSWNYAWPSKDFPYMFYMHKSKMYDHNDRKIQIRKWIENTISDLVILDDIDFSYRKFYGTKWDWENHFLIDNRWLRFSFENEHSSAVFRLAFSEWIQPLTAWHPDRPEDIDLVKISERERLEQRPSRIEGKV